MESRQMVLMNLFARPEQMQMERRDRWTRGEGEGGTNRDSRIDIRTLPRVKQVVGCCRKAQGAQLGADMTKAGGMGGGVGERLQREGMYVYL